MFYNGLHLSTSNKENYDDDDVLDNTAFSALAPLFGGRMSWLARKKLSDVVLM